MQAHRLVLLAQAQGKAHETTEALFVEQYERGGNISLLETLVRVGRDVGLEGVEAYMQSDDGLDAVVVADEHAKTRYGHTTVLQTPCNITSQRRCAGRAMLCDSRDKWQGSAAVGSTACGCICESFRASAVTRAQRLDYVPSTMCPLDIRSQSHCPMRVFVCIIDV